MKLFTRAAKQPAQIAISAMTLLGTVLLLVGCGSGSPKQTGLPKPDPLQEPATVNSYAGKVAVSATTTSNNQVWNVTIDHDKSTYSYSVASGDGTKPLPVQGTFADLNGFLLLLDQSGYQAGYALEIRGQAAIVRPGNSAVAPIFSVLPGCFPILGANVKFQYVSIPADTGTGGVSYGKIYATTSTDGKSWSFDGQTLYQMPDGKSDPTNAYLPAYPSAIAGNCSESGGAASVEIPSTAAYNVPTRFFVSPAGLFLQDQSFYKVPGLFQYGDVSSLGVTAPASAITTSAVTRGQYLGFLTEVVLGTRTTQPVGFGNLVSSSSVLSGGAFPNEDPTKAPNANMSITFGKQDPINPGLYYLAKLTLPTANIASCPTSSLGTDQYGNPTCAYNGVAMVGTVQDKFVIVMSAFTQSREQKILVLFQQ